MQIMIRKFLFQIINYDRIIERNIKGLPNIENDSVKFVREYSVNEQGLIEFKTDLLIKSTGKEIKNNVLLFPIKKQEIEVILKNAGFKNWKFYGNFKKEKWSLESIPLIVETTK